MTPLPGQSDRALSVARRLAVVTLTAEPMKTRLIVAMDDPGRFVAQLIVPNEHARTGADTFTEVGGTMLDAIDDVLRRYVVLDEDRPTSPRRWWRPWAS